MRGESICYSINSAEAKCQTLTNAMCSVGPFNLHHKTWLSFRDKSETRDVAEQQTRSKPRMRHRNTYRVSQIYWVDPSVWKYAPTGAHNNRTHSQFVLPRRPNSSIRFCRSLCLLRYGNRKAKEPSHAHVNILNHQQHSHKLKSHISLKHFWFDICAAHMFPFYPFSIDLLSRRYLHWLKYSIVMYTRVYSKRLLNTTAMVTH